MPETMAPDTVVPAATSPIPDGTRRRRLLALCVVLAVSFAHFIVTAFYYLVQGARLASVHRTQFSLVLALIAEVTSLLLLWFVLTEQGRSFRDIGLTPKWGDLGWGVVLIFGASVGGRIAVVVFQNFYSLYGGHPLQARSLNALLGVSVSSVSVLFVFVNPFFEELIVRAYTMSEVMALGGSRYIAILVSVLIQMSYHVYQGLVHCIAITVVFTVFSIYFSRTRRIGPVIVAHLWSDAFALLRLAR